MKIFRRTDGWSGLPLPVISSNVLYPCGQRGTHGVDRVYILYNTNGRALHADYRSCSLYRKYVLFFPLIHMYQSYRLLHAVTASGGSFVASARHRRRTQQLAGTAG